MTEEEEPAPKRFLPVRNHMLLTRFLRETSDREADEIRALRIWTGRGQKVP